MKSFNVKDWVTCIDDKDVDGELTKGYRYRVLGAIKDSICILNDQFTDSWYHNSRFTLVTEEKHEPAKIDNEHVYTFDVDDTLVIWDNKFAAPGEGRVAIVDPYDNHTVYLRPHTRHVKLLKQMKGRGRFVVVWSQGGAQWAAAVVEALGLKQYVNLIMTKPSGYVDDLPVGEWMQNRIFLSEEESA